MIARCHRNHNETRPRQVQLCVFAATLELGTIGDFSAYKVMNLSIFRKCHKATPGRMGRAPSFACDLGYLLDLAAAACARVAKLPDGVFPPFALAVAAWIRDAADFDMGVTPLPFAISISFRC